MRRILIWVVVIGSVGAFFFYILLSGSDMLKGVALEDAKTLSEVLFTLVQIAAIVLAGMWTYERFLKNREDYPYPDVQHKISHHKLENDFTYLSVFVTVRNAGKTKLDLSDGIIYVRKIQPLSKRIENLISNTDIALIRKGKNSDDNNKLFIDQGQRIGWETIGERTFDRTLDQDAKKKMHKLEPGQCKEIQFDFLFKDKTEVVEVLSSLKFRGSGWEYSTIHSLQDNNVES